MELAELTRWSPVRIKDAPPWTARIFGLDPAAVPTMARPEFTARALAAMLAAAATEPAQRLCLDHADLPAAVWQHVAPHFGIQVDAAAIEGMIEQARFYSKDASARLFSGDAAELRPMTDAMHEAAQRFAEPGYRALASPA